METIKDIESLEIKGANFTNKTILNLFNGKGESLIYGENGAGKSTIARGIYNYIHQTNYHDIKAVLLNSESKEIQIEDGAKHVFVFDEDYIKRIISMKSNTGLETIVILGALKDVEDLIDEQKVQLKKVEITLNKELKKLHEIEDPKKQGSKEYQKRIIIKKLKDDYSWAERYRLIHKNRTKAKVTMDRVKKIISHKAEFLHDVPKNISNNPEGMQTWAKTMVQECKKSFKNDLNLYVDTSEDADIITESINLKGNSFDEVAFTNILKKTFEKPKIIESDELLRLVTTTIQEKGIRFISDVRAEFEEEKVDRCPYCQQKVNSQWKKDLLLSISKVLETQTNDYISNQIEQFRISGLPEIDWKNFQPLGKPELVESCKNAIEVLIGKISYINHLLDRKLNNPYQPIIKEAKSIEYSSAFASALKQVTLLNNAVENYNEAIKNHQKLYQKLCGLNDYIAFWEIYGLYSILEILNQKYMDQKQTVDQIEIAKETIEKKITKLEEKKRQVNIAVDEINSSLAYIFLSTDRLKIVYDNSNNEYKIKVKQQDVHPEDISVGERNALALSYFFSEIKKEKEQEKFYKDEYLLVIDDPISSFDKENRIGVISFLRKELLKFKKGNINTKIIIMTHDMQVFFNLQKMFNSMAEELQIKVGKNLKLNKLENNQIIVINSKGFHEYSHLLKCIYRFARGEYSDDFNLEIGNMLRRVMEAYGTFLYKKGGANLFNVNIIVNKISNVARREFFRNCMIRLFVNSESHFEEDVQALNDIQFFGTLSAKKKQEYARYVLCFLYSLDSIHVLAHLGNKKFQDDNEFSIENLKMQFGKWIEQIDEIAEINVKNQGMVND